MKLSMVIWKRRAERQMATIPKLWSRKPLALRLESTDDLLFIAHCFIWKEKGALKPFTCIISWIILNEDKIYKKCTISTFLNLRNYFDVFSYKLIILRQNLTVVRWCQSGSDVWWLVKITSWAVKCRKLWLLHRHTYQS